MRRARMSSKLYKWYYEKKSVDDLRLKVPWLSVHGGGEDGLPCGGRWNQRGLHCVRCGQDKIWNLWLNINRFSQSPGRQWVHLEVSTETRDDEPWREDVGRGMQLTSWGGYLQFTWRKLVEQHVLIVHRGCRNTQTHFKIRLIETFQFRTRMHLHRGRNSCNAVLIHKFTT